MSVTSFNTKNETHHPIEKDDDCALEFRSKNLELETREGGFRIVKYTNPDDIQGHVGLIDEQAQAIINHPDVDCLDRNLVDWAWNTLIAE